MGALEEGAKAASGVIDAMRQQPLAIANIVLNLCFLIFLVYYVSIIADRAKNTVASMFAANDKLYAQWGVIVKDMGDLAEKSLHCITVDDALKLLQQRSPSQIPSPLRWPALAPVPWLDTIRMEQQK